jgi:hypothetical protein
MASLKLLLGMIPSTEKIEQAEKDLTAEYEKLQAFFNSDKLKRYNDLNDLVNSSAFIQKKKEIESLQYRNSKEYSEEKEYNTMKKARDIVLYFKTVSGSDLKRFRDIESSGKISEFEKLEKYISSEDFKKKQAAPPFTFKDTPEYKKWIEFREIKSNPEVKSYKPFRTVGSRGIKFWKPLQKEAVPKPARYLKYEELKTFVESPAFLEKKKMKPVTFRDTDEYKKLLEYREKKKSDDIKFYYKFKSSKEYANFLETDGSQRLARYNELKERIASDEFRERKNYLLDKKRFEKTGMFKDMQEYEKLKKDADIIWFFKVKDSSKFDVLKSRELTFSDEFEGEKLDTKKWITNYYSGEKLLNGRFSVDPDLQAYTGENFEIRNSVLKIVTKPQKLSGRVWSATRGFEMREFNYSSGIINSGMSFRQKYGIFSAKIRLGNPSAKNSFWMLGDKIKPHIDICRTSKGKVQMDIFSNGDKPERASLGSKYAGNFYIYTLEWTPEKLVWKINDTVVFTRTQDIPREPLFINLSGGLDKPINGMTAMEVDWVRVYKIK